MIDDTYKAAEQGYAEAQVILALMYLEGEEGVPRDEAKGLQWLQKAAKQGHAEAQYILGKRYAEGGRCTEEYTEK